MVLQVATIIIGSILCPGNPYKRYALPSMIEFGMCLSFHGSLSNGLLVTRSCLMFFWISIHGIVVYRPPYCPMEWDGKTPMFWKPCTNLYKPVWIFWSLGKLILNLPKTHFDVLFTTCWERDISTTSQVSLQYRLIPQNLSMLYSEFNQNYEQARVACANNFLDGFGEVTEKCMIPSVQL